MTRHAVSHQQFEEYQQKVASFNDTNAMYWVAYCHFHGTGGVLEKDTAQAAQILEQAVRAQDVMDNNDLRDNTGKHRFLLAYCYNLQDIVEGQRNRVHRAQQLYTQAVPRLQQEVTQQQQQQQQQEEDGINLREAACFLGQCLFYGKGGQEKDPQGGIHWWKTAAEQGHTDAQDRLEGFYFLQMPITTGDEEHQAILHWWQRLATKQNHGWAQQMLGHCYEFGTGVETDLAKAVEWYNKAITQGYSIPALASKCSLLNHLDEQERNRVLGCSKRNQNMEHVNCLAQTPINNNMPLGLWALALGAFQQQDNPPWEAHSPTYLALCTMVPQLQTTPRSPTWLFQQTRKQIAANTAARLDCGHTFTFGMGCCAGDGCVALGTTCVTNVGGVWCRGNSHPPTDTGAVVVQVAAANNVVNRVLAQASATAY